MIRSVIPPHLLFVVTGQQTLAAAFERQVFQKKSECERSRLVRQTAHMYIDSDWTSTRGHNGLG